MIVDIISDIRLENITIKRKNYKIVQFDILGNKIAEYNSVNEAQLVNDLPHLNKKLNQHFKGEYKTLYGYIWKKILL